MKMSAWELVVRMALALFTVFVIVLCVTVSLLGTSQMMNDRSPVQEPKRQEVGGSFTLDWFEVSPPRPGLRCWAAQWPAPNEAQPAMAVSYCEPKPE